MEKNIPNALPVLGIAERLTKPFSSYLSATLQFQGLSQQDVSKAVGYSEATVSKWIRGTKIPPIKAQALIGDFLKISFSRFIRGQYFKRVLAALKDRRFAINLAKSPREMEELFIGILPVDEYIKILLSEHYGVNCDYLETGKGDMFINGSKSALIEPVSIIGNTSVKINTSGRKRVIKAATA